MAKLASFWTYSYSLSYGPQSYDNNNDNKSMTIPRLSRYFAETEASQNFTSHFTQSSTQLYYHKKIQSKVCEWTFSNHAPNTVTT